MLGVTTVPSLPVLGLSARDRIEEPKSRERQTNVSLVLVFSWDFVDSNKNMKYHQLYSFTIVGIMFYDTPLHR